MPGRNWTRKSIEEMIDAYLKKRLKGGGGTGVSTGELGGAVEVQYSMDIGFGGLGQFRYQGYTYDLRPYIGEILLNKYPDITIANTIINKYHSPNNSIKTLINQYIKNTTDKTLPLHDITSVFHDLLEDEPGAPAILTFGTFVDGLIKHEDDFHYPYHNIWYDVLKRFYNNPNRQYYPWVEKYINKFLPISELFPDGNPLINNGNGYTMAHTDGFYPTHNRHEEGRVWEGPYYHGTNEDTASNAMHYKTSDLWNCYNGTLRVVNVYCGFKTNDTKLYRLEWRDTNDAKYPLSPTISGYGPFPVRPGGTYSRPQAGVYNYTTMIEDLSLYTDIGGTWPTPEGQWFRDYDGFARLNGLIDGLRMNDEEYILRRRDIVKNPLYYFMTSNPTWSWYIDKMGNEDHVLAYYLMLSEPYQVERVDNTYIYTSCLTDKEILDIYNYVFNRRLHTFYSPDPQVIKYKTEIENRIVSLGQLQDQPLWWL